MRVLVTGGSGYIGSHTVVELLNRGNQVIVIDNLSNSNIESLRRVAKITSKKLVIDGSIKDDFIFSEVELRNRDEIENIFSIYPIDAVIHFAGLKSVGESTKEPLKYYDNNVTASIILFEVMKKANVKTIIFSSSATVYNPSKVMPITEEFPVGGVSNPYGRAKLMVEDILQDIYKSDKGWKIALLRYFNPVGAHCSGMIGEDPKGMPTNLMPYISQVSIGKIKELKIFGSDYPTRDGTCVRDYIHVVDLAKGHIAALNYIYNHSSIIDVFNLGTGVGSSVLEMVSAFEKASNSKVKYKLVGRRKGDISEYWSSAQYSKNVLNWKAEYNIQDMCKDAWNWQKKNPNGYQKK